MNITGHIKVDMAPVAAIMGRLGVTAQGDVQRFHTANARRRIQKYISQDFMTVYAVVIAFYFGTQSQKVQDALEGGA